MAQYAKYKEGGLRQKVHQAIRDKHCIWCWSSQHLRSSCPEPAKKWEEDFNKGKAAFWGPKPKQARPQWLKPLHRRTPLLNFDQELLFAVDLDHLISLDTASEVSIGVIDILNNVRLAKNPVFVEGIGGTQHFCFEGELLLAGGLQLTVFAGKKGDSPPDFHALLGIKHIQDLSVSLDYAWAPWTIPVALCSRLWLSGAPTPPPLFPLFPRWEKRQKPLTSRRISFPSVSSWVCFVYGW
jgi:hypothetical protein